jgi:hypothetical protein
VIKRVYSIILRPISWLKSEYEYLEIPEILSELDEV